MQIITVDETCDFWGLQKEYYFNFWNLLDAKILEEWHGL